MGKGQHGFGTIEILLVVVLIGMLGYTGWYVWHIKNNANKMLQVSDSQTTSSSVRKNMTNNSYDGWKTFIDNASSVSSGLTIKYPADWQLNTESHAFAWTITSNLDSKSQISERNTFLPASETAKEEWLTCADKGSADACGMPPGDNVVSDSEIKVNGIDSYNATIKSSNGGQYYVTVLQGPKTESGYGFVELTYSSGKSADLDLLKQIVASSHF